MATHFTVFLLLLGTSLGLSCNEEYGTFNESSLFTVKTECNVEGATYSRTSLELTQIFEPSCTRPTRFTKVEIGLSPETADDMDDNIAETVTVIFRKAAKLVNGSYAPGSVLYDKTFADQPINQTKTYEFPVDFSNTQPLYLFAHTCHFLFLVSLL